MNWHVLNAIFKRNFTSYFSSPIGYVFICAFVLLSAFATFWPSAFFNANLANLNQLNDRLPWIMLVFIPAITMSVWADERRQGTDELLLTLPANDLDVVLGKYFAALAIFTVSLLFSLTNVIALVMLGKPDLGLLFANYLGYWFVGGAMLSVGMVASFLTSNLTVGFILGAAFNAPLAFAAGANSIFEGATGRFISAMSIDTQFDDFGQGVVSMSSIGFFLSVTVLGVFLSHILIGRRHAVPRSAGLPLAGHQVIRTLCLAVVALGVNVAFARFDWRIDCTAEKLSSLTSETRRLINRIDPERPVFIEAYISPEVPEQFVQTRSNLINVLREINAMAGDRVVVRINECDRFSREGQEAEDQFGITPRPIQSATGGRLSLEEIYLGVAFLGGLDQVVVPFFDRGMPAEYEVIRSIATVSQQRRRTVGVLLTDAQMFGRFNPQTFSSTPDQQIISELRKQYDVVRVDPASPITERYDVLLAVQPSSLTQPTMDNFIESVRSGQPTAIFEDPMSYIDPAIPGTDQPRMPPGGRNPFQQQQMPEPKGDMSALWDLLGVDVPGWEVVGDAYNPYPNVREFPPEFVFSGVGSGNPDAFNEAETTSSGLQQMMFIFPGRIVPRPLSSDRQVTPLVQSGPDTGMVAYADLFTQGVFGPSGLNEQRVYRPVQPVTLAARIIGTTSPGEEGSEATELNVTLVSDVDALSSAFFSIRARGAVEDAPVNLQVDNVTFGLNILDELANDDRFVNIRKRRPAHRTLTAVEARTSTSQAKANEKREQFIEECDASIRVEEETLQAKIEELRGRSGVDPRQMMLEIQTAQQVGQNRLQATIERLERERDRNLEAIERSLMLEVSGIQDGIKIAAVAIPPIPPLLVAGVIYFRRRRFENIGVAQSRLRAS